MPSAPAGAFVTVRIGKGANARVIPVEIVRDWTMIVRDTMPSPNHNPESNHATNHNSPLDRHGPLHGSQRAEPPGQRIASDRSAR